MVVQNPSQQSWGFDLDLKLVAAQDTYVTQGTSLLLPTVSELQSATAPTGAKGLDFCG